MNPKQFINNSICYLIDRFGVKSVFKLLALILYPDYPFIPKNNIFKSKSILIEIAKLYIFLFILLFVVQGFWAYLNNQFFPDSDPITINFLEDLENILNYTIVGQVYVILGYFFLKINYTLDESLKQTGFLEKLQIDKIEIKSKYGFFGFILLFLFTLYFSAGYAFDITNKSTSLYWFMETGPNNVTYSRLGFYYFFINFILLFFVLIVGFSFVGFIKKAGFISSKIDKILNSDKPIDKDWTNENQLKKWLAPISTQVFLIQLMVVFITLNILLWNINKQGIGTNYSATVFALILFGIWLFTLPRYYINYKIFQIWQKEGKIEYKNLNLPWIIGASSFLDIILFTFLLKNLIGESWSDLLNNLVGY